ncbi:DoxX family protein [Streptomyces sp. NRRL WC-3742]|uniref:DoxX family protein n=1 Tax=Streptomyces sp. NRRL WC-3742 TaxID=1463934 RepID=UPI00068B2690|nr:DoxX family protein [Streptomyces sp. NRRL WC-3742]
MSTNLPASTKQLAETAQPYVLAAFRVVVGLLFAFHGAASLFGVFGGAVGKHGGSVPVGEWPGWWAALIQLVGGVFVLAGAGTRWAALLCSGSMAYAYFTVHQEHSLLPLQNGGESSVMFCWAFFAIAFIGSGPYSVDALLTRRTQTAAAEPTVRSATTV